MELWHFQNLTYFLTSWPSYLTYILVQRTCRNHGLVLACNEVWWWLTEPFLRFCEISVQTNKHTNKQTNMTNEHTCQNQILASNERAIGDCVLAKICQYNAHCNGDSDKWNIVDYIHVWLVWKSIGLHVLAFWQVGWIRIHLLYPYHFDVTLWRYKWRHQHQKYVFGVNFGQSFHI